MSAPARVPDPGTRGRAGGRDRAADRTAGRRGGKQAGQRAADRTARRAQGRRVPLARRWLRVVPQGRAGVAPRAPFVLLVMSLLAAGLLASLWLSTAAGAYSYRLENTQREARDLAEQAEQLRRDVAQRESAPDVARRARELGLVPAPDPARLVVRPDGSVELRGEPRPATSSAPPSPTPSASAPPSAGAPQGQPTPPAPSGQRGQQGQTGQHPGGG
ncbi:hypothetical protein [Streptoalloteichus hindustanus]|uniref:Cell division protein FtsL n=1 Tax=Streptoalloteichus hindustanus TaxID=2017 RepID=A0A1M5AUQ7_STRHI|nr:hypothetical protein [Streptoalloteichus hindustanus]SHF33979.1 hypothetical protein SAMN05444320_103271 [Streptoalloteichus hindustanus]